jgi:hypothetical protein
LTNGNGRSASALILLACAAACFFGVLPVGNASAATTRIPEPFSPLTGSGSGLTIGVPGGIAIDETSGNVFLNDGTSKTDILGATGAAPAGLVAPFEITGLSFEEAANAIAVDNSVTSPNKGTVYVLSGKNPPKLRKFKRDGPTEKYVGAGELTISTAEASNNGGVAVDTKGNVFVGDFASESVSKFNPAGTLVKTYNFASPHPLTRPGPLAVDAAGDLFVARTGAGSVFKFPADAFGEINTSEFVEVVPGGATGVAVDPVRNLLYIAMRNAVVEYDATTLAVKSEWGLGTLGTSTRLAVDSATNRVYVSDNGNGKKNVAVFGPPVSLPTTIANSASTVTGSKATLNGTVNPEGIAVIGCEFEWGLTKPPVGGGYEHTVDCDSPPGSGSSPVPVSAEISGLVPEGTTYHYRLVASNANGTERSADRTFLTATTVDTDPATAVGTETATLRGSLHPEGSLYSSCIFEYGLTTTASFEDSVPCVPPAASIDPDFSSHPVSAPLTGLQSNVAYKFRLTATNLEGTQSGEVLTFTTSGPPQISELRASFAGQSSATLEAKIDPSGFATNYRFEWGPTTAYGTSVPADFEPFVGSGEPVRVTAKIGGLSPGTIYHFRVVATNSVDVTETPDQILETLNSCDLPEGRCLELVSPRDVGPVAKPGVSSTSLQPHFQAATEPGSLVYTNENGFPDATSGADVLYHGTRSAGGWSSTQLSPPMTTRSETKGDNSFSALMFGLSANLSCGVLGGNQPLTDDASTALVREVGGGNLYRRNVDGSYTAITKLTPENPDAGDGRITEEYVLIGVSDDCGKVIFGSPYRYPGVPAIAGERRLYEWDEGTLRSLSYVPGPSGETLVVPTIGLAGNDAVDTTNLVSSDGSRVFFTAPRQTSPNPAEVGKNGLFVREDGTSTRDLSLSETSTPNKGATYQWASEDGSRVFFTANAGLTVESSPEGTDLYEYDLKSDTLTDLSVDHDAGGAEVAGFIGGSDDGSHVYFVARGQLAPGSGKTFAQNQSDGTYSIYGAEGGVVSYTGTVQNLRVVVLEQQGSRSSRVSPDGRYLLFESTANVTGYESGGAPEAYLYDAEAPSSEATVCVSCRQDGRESVEPTANHPLARGGESNPLYSPRSLVVRDGKPQVFFESFDKLAVGGVEGEGNVYEWSHGQLFHIATEPPGIGGPETQNASEQNVNFFDASADSTDLYFATPASLNWEDRDGRYSVYDARIGGGFSEPPPPPTPCDPNSEGSCQGSFGQPPAVPNAASATFKSSGNVKPKKSKKHHTKGQKKGKHKKRSNGNRRAGK